MFCKIKYIVFKIKILTVLLLSRSFGNVIYDIAASSNGLLSTTDIRSYKLEMLQETRESWIRYNFFEELQDIQCFSKIYSCRRTI